MYKYQQVPFVKFATADADDKGTKMNFVRMSECGNEFATGEYNLPFFSSVPPKNMKRRLQLSRRIFRGMGR
jgi:hypothetical protein